MPSKSSKETSNKRKKETAEVSDQEVKQPAAKRKRTAAASQETKSSPSKDVNDNEEQTEGKAFFLFTFERFTVKVDHSGKLLISPRSPSAVQQTNRNVVVRSKQQRRQLLLRRALI